MSNPTDEFTVMVEAPVHSVFEYCLDPRMIYAGDPMMKATDAALTQEGVGTTAQLKGRMLVFTETVAVEYTEVIPDRRIVFHGDATMALAGLGRGISIATHVLTWTFAPEKGGTRLTLAVAVQNPPTWQRFLDRVFDKSSKKMFSERLARIKAASEQQAATGN